ncbi:TetR/AcrR family transcriptional regulator [Actinomadura welshii]
MAVSATGGPDRRQRRWHQAHDRLYEAACELFLESGFVETSVDDIAERADVARKTAFNHYPRKRDFISEWGRRRREQVRAAVAPLLDGSPDFEKVLRRYFAELATINRAERALTIRMSLGWRASGGPFDTDPHELVDVFRSLVADAVEQGKISAAANPSHIATILYSSYFGLLYDWCEGTDEQPPFDLHEAFEHLLDVVMTGIRSL